MIYFLASFPLRLVELKKIRDELNVILFFLVFSLSVLKILFIHLQIDPIELRRISTSFFSYVKLPEL